MEDTTLHDAAPVRRLTRSRDGRWLGGVCAGLGRYFDVSPTIYRILFAALALAGGAGALLYLAAWLVMPEEGADESAAERALRDHRDRPGFVVGIGLLAFAFVVLLAHAAFWPHPGNLWVAALVVGAGLVWWELHGGVPAEPAADGDAAAGATARARVRRPRRPSMFLPVVGVLIAAGGVLGALEAAGVHSFDLRLALAAATAFVGLAVVAGAASGRSVAGLVGLGILMLLVLVPMLVLHVPLRGGFGDRTYRPVAQQSLHRHYRLAVGNLTVDLAHATLPQGDTRVDASVGIGHLRVVVPAGATVDVTGHAGAGDVRLLGREENGGHVDESAHRAGDGRRLVLTTRVGVGQVEVLDG